MPTKSLSLFDLASGKTLLERYRIRRAHRQGGMATTFEVEDIENGGVLEMQVFPGALFESASQAADFAAALARWKDIHAKSVLAVRDVRTIEDGTVLLLTDLPPGRSLRDRLKVDGHGTPAETVAIGLQLLDELSAIHAAGLVHGDIKPHTIHIEEPARDKAGEKPKDRAKEKTGEKSKPGLRVTLVDGGITPSLWTAKHLGDKTALIGTPFYAPVEQFGGESPGVQSDIYNLATVLFEVATGVLPWKGKSFLEVFQAKLAKAPPSIRSLAPKADVPSDLESAIVGGLLAEKEERYKTAAEFKARLAAVKIA